MLPPPGQSVPPPQDEALNHALATALSSIITSITTGTSTSTSSALTLATTTALAAVTATAAGSQSSPHKDPDSDSGECELLGPFALFIQGALGVLALMSLVFKRWRERPQRPLKIWFFDASKQVVGTFLVHLANLAMSMLSAGQFSVKNVAAVAKDAYQPNPCSFYLLNLAIDTTVGIFILLLFLRILTRLFLLTSFGTPPESIQSGNYGSPPKSRWWMKQCLIYFLGLMGMKLCVLLLFAILPWISKIGDWALRWTEGDERVQVFFVMLFFPVVMNAIQYWIIDGFIKEQHGNERGDHHRVPSEDQDGEHESRDSQDDEVDGDEQRIVVDEEGSSEDPLLRKSEDSDANGKDAVVQVSKRSVL
ncbi:MAG: hypothetical protein M1814_001789 [Vezdaea aestivalis]|nr:MAG: hypothetical protein M1814_001789 [Vezdaea aestivalis]